MMHPFAPVFGAGLGPFGMWEILALLFIVMLLFGAKRLPDLARSFGKSIRELKKATSEDDDEPAEEPRAKNGVSAAKADALKKH